MADIHRKAAIAVFHLIKGEEDEMRLRYFYTVIDALYEGSEEALKGVFLELRLWCGLKIDTPSMGADYIHGVVEAFPWIED
jgi:hypothetical protein